MPRVFRLPTPFITFSAITISLVIALDPDLSVIMRRNLNKFFPGIKQSTESTDKINQIKKIPIYYKKPIKSESVKPDMECKGKIEIDQSKQSSNDNHCCPGIYRK